jgi:hypothetical protein
VTYVNQLEVPHDGVVLKVNFLGCSFMSIDIGGKARRKETTRITKT